MVIIGRGRVLTPSNSPIQFASQFRGVMTDLAALSFAIYDVSTEERQLEPVQVFPVSGFQDVDLVADRVGVGRYVATGWTVPTTGDGSAGKMRIVWQYQIAPQPDFNGQTIVQPVLSCEQDFDVLASAPLSLSGPLYCLVSDLREEGVASTVSDARLLLTILRAGQQIETWLGQYFEPRYVSEYAFNGSGSSIALFDIPIIGIETLYFRAQYVYQASLTIPPAVWKVYNRHLSGMTNPDDRQSPKIELAVEFTDHTYPEYRFPKGQQNVAVSGLFGYTDPDGSPVGCVPWGIRRACQMLVLRDLAKLTSSTRGEALQRSRLLEERTRDQSYKLDKDPRLAANGAGFSGDVEIDQLLLAYGAPFGIGGA